MPRQSLKRRADGRYACKYKDKWFYGATQQEALAAREAYKRMLESGLKAESGMVSVSSYAQRWLPIHKVDIRTDTYNAYAHYLNVLCEEIGHKILRDVVPSDIKQVYARYVGMSDSTIKKAKTLYNSLFKSAKADGLSLTNPCEDENAQPHKGTKGTHRPITHEERQLILSVEHRMRPAAMAMLYAGIRRGEAMGLIIDRDVDFKAKTLTVRGAVHLEGNKPVYESHTKSDAGLRTVPLFPPLEEAISGQHGLIMPSAAGKTCSASAFRKGWESYLVALSNKAGHPISIRSHDLRHSYCTMLRDAGVDLKIAIKWMGHADEKMILEIYDHITPEREAKAIKMVVTELRSSQNGSQT